MRNRWVIVAAGTMLHLCLGTVYAWSFFQNPITTAMGWSHSQTAWAFSLAILFLGCSAAWGGIMLPHIGPKRLAVIGAAMYAAGYIISGVALMNRSIVLLYLGFGVISGIGNGLCYVTPVATVGKWFPDKKGFATGMVVMGFGLGALVMSKGIAPTLMNITGHDLSKTFIFTGVILGAALLFASCMKNPAAGYAPPTSDPVASNEDINLMPVACILSRTWLLMWLVLFINVTVGIMFIGFQSPMLQDILAATNPGMDAAELATMGATLIAASSVCNGMGRFFWGTVSDTIGRVQTFRLILVTQLAAFLVLRHINSPVMFSIIVCYVLLCYGGGFGTIPSFILDVFGVRLMPVVYGSILTAWSLAGLVGPQLAAILKDIYPDSARQMTFSCCAVLLAIGLVTSFFLSNRPFAKKIAP